MSTSTQACITHISVQNFKSFEKLDIPVIGMKHAVLGPNSAGKSNLIDAIQFCLCLYQLGQDLDVYVNKLHEGQQTSVELTLSNGTKMKRLIVDKIVQYILNSKIASEEAYYDAVRSYFNVVPARTTENIVIQEKDVGPISNQQLLDLLETDDQLAAQYTSFEAEVAEQENIYRQNNSQLLLWRKKIENYSADEEALLEEKERQEQLGKLLKEQALLEIKAIELELELIADEDKANEQELDQAGDIEDNEREYRKLEVQIQSTNAEIEKLNLQQQQIRQKYELDTKPEIFQKESRLHMIQRELKNSNDVLVDKNKEVAQINSEIKRVTEELDEVEQLLKRHSTDIVLPNNFDALQKEFLGENQSTISEQLNAERELEGVSSKMRQIQENIEGLRDREVSIGNQLENVDEEIAAKEEQLGASRKELDALNQEIQQITNEINKNDEVLENIMQKLPKINNQLMSSVDYQKIAAEQQKYSEIMSKIRSEQIFGYVYDLFKVKNPKREEVIDFISSGFRYSVACLNFTSVENVLMLVKEMKVELEFLPIERLRSQEQDYNTSIFNLRTLGEKFKLAALVPVIDLIEFEEKYQAVFAHVFHNYFFIDQDGFEDDLERVKEINIFCREHRCRAVTSSNIIFTGEGVIQFQIGQDSKQSKQTKRLSQETAEQLVQEKQDLELRVSELEQENLSLNTKQQIIINNQLGQVNIDISKLNNQLISLVEGKNQLRNQLRQTHDDNGYLQGQLEQVRSDYERKQGKYEELTERISLAEAKFYRALDMDKATIEEIEFRNKQYDQLVEKREQLENSHKEKQGLLEELEKEINGVQNFISSTMSEQLQVTQEHGALMSHEKELQSQINQLAEHIKNKEAELDDVKKQCILVQRSLEEQSQKISEVNALLRKNEMLRQQKEQQLECVFEQIYINQIKVQSKDGALDLNMEIQHYLNAEKVSGADFLGRINLDYRAIAKYIKSGEVSERAEAVQAQVEQIEEQLNQKVAVSVNLAIINKERERLEEKEQTVKGLREQLQRAQQQLSALGQQRAKAMNARVEQLQGLCQDIYTRLTDGQGQLLFQVNDPLKPFSQDGVELLVVPPGDEVRQMSQLSGGEQALVRVALYVGLAAANGQRLLLLDEVDQNLDSDRVAKVRELLCERDGVQTIAATHSSSFALFAGQLIGLSGGRAFWVVSDE